MSGSSVCVNCRRDERSRSWHFLSAADGQASPGSSTESSWKKKRCYPTWTPQGGLPDHLYAGWLYCSRDDKGDLQMGNAVNLIHHTVYEIRLWWTVWSVWKRPDISIWKVFLSTSGNDFVALWWIFLLRSGLIIFGSMPFQRTGWFLLVLGRTWSDLLCYCIFSDVVSTSSASTEAAWHWWNSSLWNQYLFSLQKRTGVFVLCMQCNLISVQTPSTVDPLPGQKYPHHQRAGRKLLGLPVCLSPLYESEPTFYYLSRSHGQTGLGEVPLFGITSGNGMVNYGALNWESPTRLEEKNLTWEFVIERWKASMINAGSVFCWWQKSRIAELWQLEPVLFMVQCQDWNEVWSRPGIYHTKWSTTPNLCNFEPTLYPVQGECLRDRRGMEFLESDWQGIVLWRFILLEDVSHRLIELVWNVTVHPHKSSSNSTVPPHTAPHWQATPACCFIPCS